MQQGILCIGAAHVDRKAKAKTVVQFGTSIPVTVEQGLGGVARNVAENLARLGCDAAISSRLGYDKDAEWVHKHSLDLGLDVSGLVYSHNHHTASYTALLDDSGELVLGLANMEIYDEFTPDTLSALPADLFTRPIWFLDTNPPQETLQALLQKRTNQHLIAVDPVSTPKARKLLGQLSGIDFLFPNRDEAEVLSGETISTLDDVRRAGEAICAQGVGHVIITLGSEGVYVVGGQTERVFPAFSAKVLDVTGAGDALIAGFLSGYQNTQSVEVAITHGLAAAKLAIETTETVNPLLTPQRLQQVLNTPNI